MDRASEKMWECDETDGNREGKVPVKHVRTCHRNMSRNEREDVCPLAGKQSAVDVKRTESSTMLRCSKLDAGSSMCLLG